MLIRLKPGVVVAGPDVRHVGRDLYELPDHQGREVLLAGHAVAFVNPNPTGLAAATADAPDDGAETASLKSKGKRG